MSTPEIQHDAVALMRIQGVLKFMDIDPRVAKPVIDARQFMMTILREYPVAEMPR